MNKLNNKSIASLGITKGYLKLSDDLILTNDGINYHGSLIRAYKYHVNHIPIQGLVITLVDRHDNLILEIKRRYSPNKIAFLQSAIKEYLSPCYVVQ